MPIKPYRGAPRNGFSFRREWLPAPSPYYTSEGIALKGSGEWKDAKCPFHDDHRASLRVRIATGAFRCMVCGVHGAGVLDFHMTRHALSFKDAAQALGAWSVVAKDCRPTGGPPRHSSNPGAKL